ncbi:hypothetical protein J8E27_12555 [Brucella sp. 458]|uniref:hypothetical protein n=1 Tax=Brucella sp. 458 TaxID=2821140 RepID=UPI001ADFED95|nr:hypothetical protein [Brucella sp. 458]QTO00542.1 hypothetical protein J8E27_12555 [Brucella sp. 458]
MTDLRLRINELPEELNPALIDNIAIDGPSTRRTTLQRAADAVRPYSTEAMAREGLNNATAMTPLRTAQAIETLGGERFASSQQGNIADAAVRTVNGKSGNNVTLTKADVGLGNVDNTPDMDKPLSNAMQVALAGKATTEQGTKADTAIQAPGGDAGQVLTKASSATNDVEWSTVEAATAVSYGPQTLTTEQQDQARQNIGAMPANAATKGSIADADGVAITDSADSGKPKRALWSVLKAALAVIHYTKAEVNNLLAGNMAGRAYPRISSGGPMNVVWGDNGANPLYVLGTPADNAASEVRPYPMARLQVNWADSAAYADRIGNNGWTQADLQSQLNWRVSDTRFNGYIEQNFVIPTTGDFSTIVPGAPGYVVVGIWTWGPGRNLSCSFRQPQIYIPNAGGWRPLGSW